VATQFFWVGPGEFVVLDIARTGRIGAEAVVLAIAVLLAALTSARSVRLGIRAGLDLITRLVLLPLHSWSAVMLLVDVVVIAAAWRVAGRAGSAEGDR
jgi:hypothetical protein